MWRDGNPKLKKWKETYFRKGKYWECSLHMWVLWVQLPLETFRQWQQLGGVWEFFHKITISVPNLDVQKWKVFLKLLHRILRKPASINSDPGSHCQPSSWMTWADLWWFRIIYSIMWILISEPSFVSTSAGKGQRYISVMIPTSQISPFHLLLRIVWMKTNTEQNLFLGVCYFSKQIFSWVVI